MTNDSPTPQRFIPDPSGAWLSAVFCAFPAGMLLGNVLSQGVFVPHFASDLAWCIMWSIGVLAGLTTAVMRTIGRRGR